jgi:hypothetical protein
VRGRFIKGHEVLSYEVRRDPAYGHYHLHVSYPDGTETTEEIAHASDLIDHVAQLMRQLRRDGWTLDPQ